VPSRPAHGTASEAYDEVFTVIHDLGEGADIAWIHGAVWPPVGTVVELDSPERHALVVGIRLVLLRGNRVLVRVDVQDPGEGELIARDFATRMLTEEAMSVGAEPHVPVTVGEESDDDAGR
jgi:hypothetical protein